MQYSLLDKYKMFALQHRKIVVFSLCILIFSVFIYCFNDGYSMRAENDEFSEIQSFIDEIREKDKSLNSKLEVDIVRRKVKGIDVSEFQRDIDWEKVKESGIDFVMIRCGFRSMLKGDIRED